MLKNPESPAVQTSPPPRTPITVRRTLIPLGLAVALFYGRKTWFTAWCAQDPTPCVRESVNALDQIAFQYGSIQADFWSNVVQNTVGAVFFLSPFWFALQRKITWPTAIHQLFTFVQVMLWNFVSIEIVRAIIQRPRPLVFASPMGDGANIHQYTSFYSGHTSFVALAMTSLVFYVPAVSQRPESRRLWIGLALILIALTGALRVWGGRHYPTDVLAGGLAGALIAWGLRGRTRENT